MSGFTSIFGKELSSVLKEKTIVLAIVIQLLIAAFSSVILIGLMSFYDPSSIGEHTSLHFNIGLAGEDNAGPFAAYLRATGSTVTTFSSGEEALNSMQSGGVDAVAIIPASKGVVNMQLYLPQSDSRATVITMVLKEPLIEYENYLREQDGVEVRYTDMKGMSSTTYEFLYSLIIPLLMFFPAFIAGSVIIDSISEEIENKTLDTLLSGPLTLNTILSGKIASAMFLAVVQCIMWWLLLSLNRLYVQNAWLVLLLAFIVSGFVAYGSALISMYFKDRERSQFAFSILLMTVAGASLFINPSPISLMARLATGDPGVGMANVSLFVIPLIALMIVFYYTSKRLLAYKA